jgi:uncharacterized protein with PQ loop repeat
LAGTLAADATAETADVTGCAVACSTGSAGAATTVNAATAAANLLRMSPHPYSCRHLRQRHCNREAIFALGRGWNLIKVGEPAVHAGFPTVVDNDLVAFTQAEQWFGAGRALGRFAVLDTVVLSVLALLPCRQHGPTAERALSFEREVVAMLANVIGWTAASWGVVMALSPMLQLRRMLRTKSSDDVSVGYFLLLIPGFALWVLYGSVRHDLVLAVPNALAAVIGVTVIVTASRLRSTRGRREPDRSTDRL